MSLINEVLQDLEKRQAGRSEDLSLSAEVRAVAASPRSRWQSSVVVLAILSAVLISVTPVWTSILSIGERFADRWGTRQGDSQNAVPVAARSGTALAHVDNVSLERQVESALIIPVFQLSQELALKTSSSQTTAGNQPVLQPTSAHKPELGEANQKLMHSEKAPAAGAKKEGDLSAMQREKRPQAAAALPTVESPAHIEVATPQKKQRVSSETPASGVESSAATASKPSGDPRLPPNDSNPAIEEVVIPETPALQPIDKQTRQLTAFERAENAFRSGVASLRQGRLNDAEVRFRNAIDEDHSHVAAQRALIGMLIDSGRYAEAELVLEESLDINPRQPEQVMILARLQVERGALQSAIQSLQGGLAYADADAEYRAFLAAVLQRAGKHEQAISEYRLALMLRPNNPVWSMGLAISLRALGQDQQAREAFHEAGASKRLPSGLQAFVERQLTELGTRNN